MRSDMDDGGGANAEGDDGGEVELNEKELGKALAKAFDHFFASLEFLSGTSLEFEGQDDEQGQSLDDVASWLFREGESDGTERTE